MSYPQLILLISGKRKCGKDYISAKLERFAEEKCTILRISEPIKSHYAKTFKLDLAELLSNGPYKEKYRLDMINWGEEVRKKDYGYFCRIACQNAPLKFLWIVSDIRRKSDIKWFRETYGDKIRTIRINADQQIREQRGWTFVEGVDDVPSECDLDDYDNTWDFYFDNNNDAQAQSILETISKVVCNSIS